MGKLVELGIVSPLQAIAIVFEANDGSGEFFNPCWFFPAEQMYQALAEEIVQPAC